MSLFRKLLRTGILLGFVICFPVLSCKKKEIPGPQGDPGAPGTGGNAFISSSSVFEVQSSQWQKDTVANVRRVILIRPEITSEVISKGSVKVFMQTPSVFTEPSWAPLPLVQGDLFTQFGYDEGRLHLDFVNIEGGIPSAPATTNFRMVITKEIQ